MESLFVMAQVAPTEYPKDNLEKADSLVKEVAEKYHPGMIIFPETFMSRFPAGTDIATANAVAEPLDGEFVQGMKKLAADHDVWLTFGMKETIEDPADHRCYNTVVMVNNKGEIVQTYRKTHLYDAFGYKESNEYKAGDKFFEPVDTPFGKLGLFVCYEVRFPEVARYQKAKGAEIVIMPTAWFKGDLKSHQFRTLITSRALENTFFVFACDQCGGTAMGESVAVDPMGVAFAAGNEREELIPVYVDTDRIKEVESKLPSFKDRRPALYI